LRARVQVEPEEREDPLSGRRQVRMRVPYLGYGPAVPAEGEGTAPVARVDAAGRNGEPAGDAGRADDDTVF